MLFTAADKQGAAFCAGALLALRDLELLHNCQDIMAVGAANFMLYALTRVLTRVSKNQVEAQWHQIIDGDLLRNDVLDELRQLLQCHHEWQIFYRRMISPCKWMTSWSEGMQDYVSVYHSDLGHTTSALETDRRYESKCRMPVFTVVGMDAGSCTLQAFSTATLDRSIFLNQQLCIHGACHSDKFGALCFAVGSPSFFAGAAAEASSDRITTNAIETHPIPCDVADTIYLHRRMNTSFSEDRLGCNRLILVDAYSGSMRDRVADAAVRKSARQAIQTLRSAADAKQETLRAYGHTVIQQYAEMPLLLYQPNDVGNGNERVQSASSLKKLYDRFHKCCLRMEPLDQSDFELCVNWGYLLTVHYYCASPDLHDVLHPPFESHPLIEELRSILA